MSHIVAIDAGGTNLRVARVDTETHAISQRRQIATPTGGDEVLRACQELVRSVADGHTTAIGIGVPELVDQDGQVVSAANWDWRETDLESAFDAIAPTQVVSDVWAAALAEATLGAGRGCDSFFYVSIGTGISSTLVIHGRPWAGHTGRAILLGAPLVESIASGRAIAKVTGLPSAEDAFADRAAQGAITKAADALGLELARAVHLLDPERVVLGGGLGMDARYRELISTALRRQIDSTYAAPPTIVAADLGDDAGLLGAALAVAR